jgi:hypothetical protein
MGRVLDGFKHRLGHVWAHLDGGDLGEQQKMKKGSDEDWGEEQQKMKKGSDEDWGQEQQMNGRLSCSPSSPFSSMCPCSSFTVIHPSVWRSRGAVGAMEVELVQLVSCLLVVFIVVHPPRGWSKEAAGCDGGGASLTPEDKADVGCGW